jgi:hypothetical protein
VVPPSPFPLPPSSPIVTGSFPLSLDWPLGTPGCSPFFLLFGSTGPLPTSPPSFLHPPSSPPHIPPLDPLKPSLPLPFSRFPGQIAGGNKPPSLPRNIYALQSKDKLKGPIPSKGGLTLDPPQASQDGRKSHMCKSKEKVVVEVHRGTQSTISKALRVGSCPTPPPPPKKKYHFVL